MKRRTWISLVLIVCCAAAMAGYRLWDRLYSDTVAPVIHMDGQLLEISALDPRAALLQGVSASDSRDGDVTQSLVVESVRLVHSDGTVAVTYAAFDKSGNVAKATREVRFHDYESPKFSLSRPLLFSRNTGYDVLNIIGAEDMLDGNISHRIRATVLDEVEKDSAGSHNVQFRVTNSLGETVELVLPVEIYTPGLFEGSLTLTDYLVYLKQGDTFNARSYLKSVWLGRDEISLRGGPGEDMNLIVSGRVETGVPGVYTVDYELSYEQNGQYYTAYSRLIVVVEA